MKRKIDYQNKKTLSAKQEMRNDFFSYTKNFNTNQCDWQSKSFNLFVSFFFFFFYEKCGGKYG